MYLRNVPDEVSERLERLASRERMSVSAFVIRELAELARRADNTALLGDLPDAGIRADDVLADLDAGSFGSVMVIAASAVVLGLLNDADARRVMTDEGLAVPHLVDSEVAHALRGQVARSVVIETTTSEALGRVWELRENVSADDGTYCEA